MLGKAVLMGGTGSVGRRLLQTELLPYFEQVTVLTRRPSVNYKGPHKERLKVATVDFEKPAKEFQSLLQGHSFFFCCHGTTRAQAGSSEAFRRIDRDYVLDYAKAFQEANPGNTNLHFLLVSAANSDAHSWFLYGKTKAQLEMGLATLNFPQLSILRPGMLKGRQQEGEPTRWLEVIGAWVGPWIRMPFVESQQVAEALSMIARSAPKNEAGKLLLAREPQQQVWDTPSQGNIHLFSNQQILDMTK